MKKSIFILFIFFAACSDDDPSDQIPGNEEEEKEVEAKLYPTAALTIENTLSTKTTAQLEISEVGNQQVNHLSPMLHCHLTLEMICKPKQEKDLTT